MNFTKNEQFTAKAQETDKKIEGVFTSENDEFIVEKHFISSEPPFEFRLAIKRSDKDTIRSWRILQDIKNALVGEDATAVEIYPKETEVTDTANMYHLWVFVKGYAPIVSLVPPQNPA